MPSGCMPGRQALSNSASVPGLIRRVVIQTKCSSMVASSGTGGQPPAPVGGDLFPVIVPRSRREREGAKRHVPSTRLRRFIAALAAITGGVPAWAAVPAASAATIPVPCPGTAYGPATPGGTAQLITAGGTTAVLLDRTRAGRRSASATRRHFRGSPANASRARAMATVQAQQPCEAPPASQPASQPEHPDLQPPADNRQTAPGRAERRVCVR